MIRRPPRSTRPDTPFPYPPPFRSPWPNADAALASDERAVLAVQVNGKKRATITLPVDSAEDVARSAALAEPAVQRAMDGKAARKVIVVRNRIVNVVV